MWELAHKEGWALKIWCFQIVVLEKTQLLWTASRPDQSILKEINPEYSLKGLTLKLQYFVHVMQRANSLKKTLLLGKIEGKRRKRRQRVRWLDSITDSLDTNLSKLQEILEDRGTWCAVVHRFAKCWTLPNNWTKTILLYLDDLNVKVYIERLECYKFPDINRCIPLFSSKIPLRINSLMQLQSQ